MNAWQRLLAASSLAIGTAWDLITHPKLGGAGVIVNNGATIQLADGSVTASIAPGFDVALASQSFAVAITEPHITVALTPAIVAQITPIQIGATV